MKRILVLFALFAVAAGYAQTVEKADLRLCRQADRHAAAGPLRGAHARQPDQTLPDVRLRRRFRGRPARQCELPFVFRILRPERVCGRVDRLPARHEEGHAGRNAQRGDLPRSLDHDPCDGDRRPLRRYGLRLRPCVRVGRGQNPDRGERFERRSHYGTDGRIRHLQRASAGAAEAPAGL